MSDSDVGDNEQKKKKKHMEKILTRSIIQSTIYNFRFLRTVINGSQKKKKKPITFTGKITF